MTGPVGTRSSPHGWRIGSLGGIPVYLARSWPIIAILIVALFGPTLDTGSRSTVTAYLIAFGYAALLLVSVLLHEAAHALAARWKGQRVDRVVADMWGGHTVYDATRSTPGSVAFIAAVGPVTNLLLGAIGWLALPLVTGDVATRLVDGLTWTNLLVGVFNLVPGLPLDGGQIVSALVWRVTGKRSAGLVAAGWLGRIVALVLLVWQAVLPAVSGEDSGFGVLLWVVIALFLWKGASDAIRSGPIMDATAGPVVDVLEPAIVVGVAETVDAAVGRALGQPGPVIVVVSDERGRPVGTLSAEVAQSVPVDERSRTPVAAVYSVQPESWVVRLAEDATVADLVRPMVLSSLSSAVVVDGGSGRVLGVARAERMNDYIGSALERRRR
jgi:Zn-dependent protease